MADNMVAPSCGQPCELLQAAATGGIATASALSGDGGTNQHAQNSSRHALLATLEWRIAKQCDAALRCKVVHGWRLRGTLP